MFIVKDLNPALGFQDPKILSKREFDRLTNIHSVNPVEAIETGLAQCCGYAMYVRSLNPEQTDLEFTYKLSELLIIMLKACDINGVSIVEEVLNASK